MEIIQARGPAATYLASGLREQDFTLFDIGCSGGIDDVWRLFGTHLRAIGFDPNIEEIARLNEIETFDRVRFEAAFVGVPDDHPLALKRAGQSTNGRNPWARLATCRTLEILNEQIKISADREKMQKFNAWRLTTLANPKRVVLPDYIAHREISSIDFVMLSPDVG